MSVAKVGSVTVILYLRASINFYPYFPHFFTDLGKKERYIKVLNDSEFHENRCSENHTLLGG
jgi:hypothetical protein